MKSSQSIDAVTTWPPAWRMAATPAQTSIHCISWPPNSTPAEPLVCPGITICVITQREVAGVSSSMPEDYQSIVLGLGAGGTPALATGLGPRTPDRTDFSMNGPRPGAGSQLDCSTAAGMPAATAETHRTV